MLDYPCILQTIRVFVQASVQSIPNARLSLHPADYPSLCPGFRSEHSQCSIIPASCRLSESLSRLPFRAFPMLDYPCILSESLSKLPFRAFPMLDCPCILQTIRVFVQASVQSISNARLSLHPADYPSLCPSFRSEHSRCSIVPASCRLSESLS